ncbi:MAG: type III pantothenate kinase [Alphaproteobacteria bacterium]
MLLAIDAGNTNIVFAVFSGKELLGSWRAQTKADRTADEHAVFLRAWLKESKLDPGGLEAAIISSVVPDANFHLARLCTVYLKLQPLFIGDPRLDIGVKVRIDRPEEIGADRLVNTVAALAQHKPPFLIVDFGTATTIDYIDAAGDYCGGVIAPGANLSLQALHMAAAKLPRVAMAKPPSLIGTNTVGAMQSGIFWGYIGMLEGLVARMQEEIGQKTPVIATGGLSGLFATATDLFTHRDVDLTLRGLQIVYERNSGKVIAL